MNYIISLYTNTLIEAYLENPSLARMSRGPHFIII